MSFKVLKIVFKVGTILGVTPPYNKTKTSCFRKIYHYFIIAFITCGLATSVYFRKSSYLRFFFLKAVSQILVESSLYFLNIHAVFAALRKKRQWYKLLQNLKTVQAESKNGFHCVIFIASNLIFCAYQTYMTLIVTRILGVNFYKQFAIEYLQLYNQFIVNYLLFVFLTMLLDRYQRLGDNLKKLKTSGYQYSLCVVNEAAYDVCLLKESVDILNDIFGWPILLTVAFTGLQMLIYLEITIVIPRLGGAVISYIVAIILWHGVGFRGSIDVF